MYTHPEWLTSDARFHAEQYSGLPEGDYFVTGIEQMYERIKVIKIMRNSDSAAWKIVCPPEDEADYGLKESTAFSTYETNGSEIDWTSIHQSDFDISPPN